MSLTDKIPQITKAEITGDNKKVIQVYVDGIPYIRTHGGGFSNEHSKILETLIRDFSEQAGIDILGEAKGFGCPPAQGVRYVLVGAGKVDGDVERRSAIFYGKSEGYNMKIDAEHLEKIKTLLPDWKFRVI